MTKRGPRKSVTSCTRIGDYGDVSWFVELECGHTMSRNRKAELGSKLSCSACAGTSTASGKEVDYVSSDFEEVKAVSKIAAHFNVRMDQVQLGRGMAVIYIDAEDINRIIS